MKVSPIDVAASLITNGEFTPFHALARLYSRAEFRTSITPAITVDVASLDGGQSGEPSAILKMLRPTLVLAGPEGTKIIAPHGEAGRNGGLTGAIFLAILVGGPFLAGYALGEKRRRRSR